MILEVINCYYEEDLIKKPPESTLKLEAPIGTSARAILQEIKDVLKPENPPSAFRSAAIRTKLGVKSARALATGSSYLDDKLHPGQSWLLTISKFDIIRIEIAHEVD